MSSAGLRLRRPPILVMGLILIALATSSCGSGNSDPANHVQRDPAPSVLSIAPATATAGQSGFTLTVNGSGYATGSTVLWNGGTTPTTFVSSSQLTANILATDVASAGKAQIQVSDPSPGGLSSAIVLQINNPVPALISFSPFGATSGGASFVLTLRGSNFVSNAAVQWNGSARTTTFVSGSQLTAEISANDIATPGIAQVTVSNPAPGGGASNTFRFGIDSGSAVQDFLYASNFADNTISGYSLDPSTGALSVISGSPFAAAPYATNPGPMIMDRFGKFLYVANSANVVCKSCWSVSGLATDGSSGSLAAIADSPFFNSAPTAFAVDPTGNIIYFSGGPGSGPADILTMFINASSGALTQLAYSSGFPLFSSLVENPAGTFLYGASQVLGSTNGVWAGSISPTTGAVTLVSGSPFGAIALSALAIDPSASFLFAVNDNGGNVPNSSLLSFAIDPTTGALTLLNSAAYNSPVLLGDVLVHPSGEFLYVSDQGDHTIMGFSIDAHGNLTGVAGSPFPVGAGAINPNFMATDPAGKFLYVANYDAGNGVPSNISAFTIDTISGALTAIAGSPFPVGSGPDSIVIGP